MNKKLENRKSIYYPIIFSHFFCFYLVILYIVTFPSSSSSASSFSPIFLICVIVWQNARKEMKMKLLWELENFRFNWKIVLTLISAHFLMIVGIQ